MRLDNASAETIQLAMNYEARAEVLRSGDFLNAVVIAKRSARKGEEHWRRHRRSMMRALALRNEHVTRLLTGGRQSGETCPKRLLQQSRFADSDCGKTGEGRICMRLVRLDFDLN